LCFILNYLNKTKKHLSSLVFTKEKEKMNSDKKTFKIFYGESDIRRFTLCPVTWENFLKQLTVPAGQKLVYVDEDSDRCTLSSEREFQGMLDYFAKESVIKIYMSGQNNINNNNNNKSSPISSPQSPPPEGAGAGKYRIVVPAFVGLSESVPSCVSPYLCVTKKGTDTNIDVDYTALMQEVQTCSSNLAAKTPQELKRAKDYINSLLEPSNLECMSQKLRGQAESVGAALESFMAELARQFEENRKQIISQKIEQQKLPVNQQQPEIKKEEPKEVEPIPEIKKEEVVVDMKEEPKEKKLRFAEVEKPYQYATQLKELMLMGFPETESRESLSVFNGNVETAIDELLNSDFQHI